MGIMETTYNGGTLLDTSDTIQACRGYLTTDLLDSK